MSTIGIIIGIIAGEAILGAVLAIVRYCIINKTKKDIDDFYRIQRERDGNELFKDHDKEK